MTSSHFSGGHSCRGLWVGGLVLDHISAHQLRNSVQIAALIPGPGLAGGSSMPQQPIGVTWPTKRSSLIGLGGWQRPHGRVSGTLSVHTNTSALCIFSGGGGALGLPDMRTLGCFFFFCRTVTFACFSTLCTSLCCSFKDKLEVVKSSFHVVLHKV